MTSPPPKVLHVFVSSPGDCAEERDLVESVLTEINSSDAATQSNIELKAIRWESLPPGETLAQDYQGRIDDLLKRVGLDCFEIYIGFMRERVGTPTHGQPSGTLNEFETALARRRRTGLPAEVLFYFLGDSTKSPSEVVAIQENLRARGFLFSETPSQELFLIRLREHLLHIVAGWWQWKNRLRRQLRDIKIAFSSLVALALFGYLAFDALTLYQIEHNLQNRAFEPAIEIWRTRSNYLILTRLAQTREIEDALSLVATYKLIDSLSSQGFDPFSWKREHLRPFETSALVAYARQRVTEDPTLSHETDPVRRLALVALTENWSIAKRLATDALRQSRSNDPPEVRGLIMNAPASEVGVWLREGLEPEMPSYIAASILEHVAQRGDSSINFYTLEALRTGSLGPDAQRFDLSMTCDHKIPACSELASKMLVMWLGDGGPLPVPALGLLLTWADPESLTKEEWTSVEKRLVQLLTDSAYSEISPELITMLARSGSHAARKELRNRILKHVNGHFSFGFAERGALIRALPHLALKAPEIAGLEIVKRSVAEANSLYDPRFKPSDGNVQSAYLQLLSQVPHLHWTKHRSWVGKLLERRVRNDIQDFQRTEFDRAFAALLARIDASIFLDLFGKSTPAAVDSIDIKLSDRRSYLLGLLSDDHSPLSPSIVEAVCHSIPALESNRPSFYQALALHGGQVGRACLKRQLAGDPETIRYLGIADDIETLVENLPVATLPQPRVDIDKLLTAAKGLTQAQQRNFIAAALQRLPEAKRSLLWPLAGAIGLADPALLTAAVGELERAETPELFRSALLYLNAVAPDRIWNILKTPVVKERFGSLMSRVEEFDWISIAQILPEVKHESDTSVLEICLLNRRLLVAFDNTQIDAVAKLPDRLMTARSKVVGNPLGRLLTLRGGSHSAAILRQSRYKATPVDVLGTLPDKNLMYDAYMNWLLAEIVASKENSDPELIPKEELTGWLAGTDPVMVRALASLTLAVLQRTPCSNNSMATQSPPLCSAQTNKVSFPDSPN
jgi:hypothetical protein